MMSSFLVHIFLLSVFAVRHALTSCTFPEDMQMKTQDPPWHSHVKADGSRDAEYYIRHNVIEIHFPKSDKPHVRWKCTMAFHGKLLLKRQDHLINNYYRCTQFLFRSPSIVQIKWSHESKVFDLGLCEDHHLKLDPWPLVWFGTLETDYKPCPFSGGFDMKLVDSQLGENGCNLMLQPMRMEAECIGGEGVTFNYVNNDCLPDINMYVKQRTVCVTDWKDSNNHYVILRRNEDTDLWCLVMPIHRGTDTKAYLFSDLACRSDTDNLKTVTDIKFFTLLLNKRVFSSLCEDEYDECATVTCNSYVQHECHKSCGMCDPKSPPASCEYPRRFRGSWFLKDTEDYNHIELGVSNFSIEDIGTFQCVAYPDSPPRKSRTYTAVSLYENGCRPRYTCVKLHRLAPSVLRYSLSQSYVWPELEHDFGTSICNEDRFHPDPSPLDDRYRSHEGAGKPIIALHPKPEPVHCNITSVHTLSATLPEGYICSGSLFRHCEDPTKVRLEFDSCGTLIADKTDYQCLGNFEGHYWERILLVQNLHDEMDAICFVFSQFYSNEAYAMVASQCDKKSFNFARSGLRQPLLKLEYRTESETCRSVPVVHTTTTIKPVPISHGSLHPDGSMRDESRGHRTNSSRLRADHRTPVSLVVTVPPGEKSGQVKDGTYNNAGGVRDTPSAKSTSLGGGDSLRSERDRNSVGTLAPSFGFLSLFVIISSLCS